MFRPDPGGTAAAIDYSLKRWRAIARFLGDGQHCMSNSSAERAVRGITVGRRDWTFCGSDPGGARAAAMFSLFATCKLNDIYLRVARAIAAASPLGPPEA